MSVITLRFMVATATSWSLCLSGTDIEQWNSDRVFSGPTGSSLVTLDYVVLRVPNLELKDPEGTLSMFHRLITGSVGHCVLAVENIDWWDMDRNLGSPNWGDHQTYNIKKHRPRATRCSEALI